MTPQQQARRRQHKAKRRAIKEQLKAEKKKETTKAIPAARNDQHDDPDLDNPQPLDLELLRKSQVPSSYLDPLVQEIWIRSMRGFNPSAANHVHGQVNEIERRKQEISERNIAFRPLRWLVEGGSAVMFEFLEGWDSAKVMNLERWPRFTSDGSVHSELQVRGVSHHTALRCFLSFNKNTLVPQWSPGVMTRYPFITKSFVVQAYCIVSSVPDFTHFRNLATLLAAELLDDSFHPSHESENCLKEVEIQSLPWYVANELPRLRSCIHSGSSYYLFAYLRAHMHIYVFACVPLKQLILIFTRLCHAIDKVGMEPFQRQFRLTVLNLLQHIRGQLVIAERVARPVLEAVLHEKLPHRALRDETKMMIETFQWAHTATLATFLFVAQLSTSETFLLDNYNGTAHEIRHYAEQKACNLALRVLAREMTSCGLGLKQLRLPEAKLDLEHDLFNAAMFRGCWPDNGIYPQLPTDSNVIFNRSNTGIQATSSSDSEQDEDKMLATQNNVGIGQGTIASSPLPTHLQDAIKQSEDQMMDLWEILLQQRWNSNEITTLCD